MIYHPNGMVNMMFILIYRLSLINLFPFNFKAWLRMRRQDPPTIEESMRNLQRIKKFQSQKSSETKIDPQSTVFPKFDEYEQSPGSKYKP